MNESRTRRRFGLGVAVCLLLSVATTIQASERRAAQELLKRMVHAVRSTNYVGTCVYRFGDHLLAMRIVHQAKKGYRHERLIALNGPAREIIRNHARATYIQPPTHAITENFPLLHIPPSVVFLGNLGRSVALDELYDVYDLEVLGSGRVAGREVRRLSIVPHDHFRYGYRLWIDKRSGLLLRSDLIGKNGTPLKQIMFTAIEIRETIPGEWLDPTLNGEKITWSRQQASLAAVTSTGPTWMIGELPEGFQLTFRGRYPLEGSGDDLVEHWLYSDGLATVSVYIEKKGEHPFNGWSRKGAVSVFGRTLHGYQIIVIGAVPPKTVRRIGASVQARQLESQVSKVSATTLEKTLGH